MINTRRVLVSLVTHAVVLVAGFGLGIYMLPILTAPEGLGAEVIRAAASSAVFTGQFRRDLEDSDAFHWGEGTLSITNTNIVLEGQIAPGPDYRLYLSPQFVETEADFEALKSQMVQVGHVRTFENFAVTVPESINPAEFSSAVVWCESFRQFITAAKYQ